MQAEHDLGGIYDLLLRYGTTTPVSADRDPELHRAIAGLSHHAHGALLIGKHHFNPTILRTAFG